MKAKARRVDSGTWPLYVIQLTFSLVSAMLQIVTGTIPESVRDNSPTWYDTVYIIGQPLGSILVLVSLFLVKALSPSLRLEQIGCILNALVGIGYVVAVTINNGGPPVVNGTWMVVGFCVYSLWRINEINKILWNVDLLGWMRKEKSHGRSA